MFLSKKLNMGAGIPVTTDPQFNYVTMLLHGDGTNGAQNNTFLDSSPNTLSLTRNGNPTQGSFSPYGSNWSNYFDGGTSTGLQTPTSTNLNLTGDFTIECWFNFTSTAGVYSAMWTCGNGLFGIESSIAYNYPVANVFNFSVQGTGILSSGAISLNTWYHIAVTRSGSTTRMFINGSIVATSTASYTMTDATVYPNTIGNRVPSAPSANYPFYGYISNFRIVKGTAVYTSAFTPSTTPLTAISGTALLTCADNRFIDDSANNFTITANGTPSVQRFNPFGTSTAYSTSVIGGSGYFDGAGDYVSTPSTSNLAFGSGAFTIEAWVYATALGSFAGVFSQWPDNGGSANNSYTLESVGSLMQFYWVESTNFYGPANLGSIQIGEWTHYAICRSGNTLYPFKNGVLGTTTSISQTLNSPSSNVNIGGAVAGSGMWNGYIANLRVLKGTALYTSNFTPPTSPVTAIANTQLLTNFTNGAIFDNAMINDLQTGGNAQISTSVVKFGTGSMYFDGTGDFLRFPKLGTLDFGTGNFTIEMWVNPSANQASYAQLLNKGPTEIFNFNFLPSTTTLSFYAGGFLITASSSLTIGAWTHVALVRNNGTLTLYQGGVSVGSAAYTTNVTDDYGHIGCSVGESDYFYNGYLDDIRITKGFARYTANFTPPTAAFLNIGPY